jgi:hypothetical protein
MSLKRDDTYLLRHRCHDVAHILQRWKKLAKAARLKLSVLHVTSLGFPVIALETKNQSPGGLYLSAGIHGDEAAPPTALLEWAEDNIERLRTSSAMILPLLNPIGILGNFRVNEDGQDLNRLFHDDNHPLISAWNEFIKGRVFSMCVMLHEDYDAQGLYVYQLGEKAETVADRFLENASKFVPRDQRRMIEGSKARGGVIQRRRLPKNLPGLPEAIVLYRKNSPITLTFETPSEYGLQDRVNAHRSVIDQSFEFSSLGPLASGRRKL